MYNHIMNTIPNAKILEQAEFLQSQIEEALRQFANETYTREVKEAIRISIDQILEPICANEEIYAYKVIYDYTADDELHVIVMVAPERNSFKNNYEINITMYMTNGIN